MLGSALIVFREVFEAALIVGIVLAATQGVPRRSFWIALGIAGGVFGAGLVAAFAETIAGAAEGFGQEYFNATVMFIAVGMLTWHQVWMSKHGREMAKHMSEVGKSVKDGGQPLYVLAVVVGAAILREGSEAVLFLYGIAASGGDSQAQLIGGGLIGLLGGVVCGAALYLGLLRIPTRQLFAVTGWMIILLAAGMASQGAAFLVQAGVLPALGDQIWNTSSFLAQDSMLGRVMHTLVGYDARPAGIQLVFYGVTLVSIISLSKWIARKQ
ncbi:MAG: FTR1 family protein [Burkholderiales bacterium]|nr:FTR1 family protein [Burkholderiales bacterium]